MRSSLSNGVLNYPNMQNYADAQYMQQGQPMMQQVGELGDLDDSGKESLVKRM